MSALRFLCRFLHVKLKGLAGLLVLATEWFGLKLISVEMLEDTGEKASSNEYAESGWKEPKSFLPNFLHTPFV